MKGRPAMPSLLANESTVQRLISAAGSAPSIHNTQPWRFQVKGHDVIEMHADPDRVLWVADPRGHALYLSCGAALFNLRLAIRTACCRPLVWALPDPCREPLLLASVQVAQGRPPSLTECELMAAIPARHTNRAPFADRPVPAAVRAELGRAAGLERGMLRMLTDRQAARVLELASAADQELAADTVHLAELRQWMTAGPAGDGVPPQALGPLPRDEPAPVRDFWGARADPWRSVDTFESRPQLAVLSTAHDEPASWLQAGQALQRVVLTATRYGVAASFLYQPIELHEMRQSHGWWPWQERPQMIIRFGYGPPSAGALRRSFTDILDRPAC
jgi:hypothetical protein